MDFIYPQQPMSIASTTAPGSGGVVIPPQMQKILDQPGYLSHEKGGLELRRMYSDRTFVCLLSILRLPLTFCCRSFRFQP